MKRKHRQWHLWIWILATGTLAAVVYLALVERPVLTPNPTTPQLSSSADY